MKNKQTLESIFKKCAQTLILSITLLPLTLGNNLHPSGNLSTKSGFAFQKMVQLQKSIQLQWQKRLPSSSHFKISQTGLFEVVMPFVSENCDNGIDDDGDDLIDEADPDCGCSETIMLVARDNGKILRLNLTTGETQVVANSWYTNQNLNALAANPDNGLIYYCRDKIVYYWIPSTGEQDTVVNLQGKIGGGESLSSGGGEYYNGYIYLGTENGNPGANPKVWRQQLSPDGKSAVGNPVNLNVPIPSYTSWGDMIATSEGGQVVIYGMTAASTSHFWKFNVSTGSFNTIRNNLPTEMQIGVDIDGNAWAGSLSSGMIQKINRNTGYFYGNVHYFGGKIWDLTGPINCPQAVEICNNGIDDDNDGYTDNQDQDCLCPDITPNDNTTRSICEGETLTLNVSSNAPNPPYSYIEFYRFDSPQSNPYTSSDPKVWLGEFANSGSGFISTGNFPVNSGNSKTYYVYGCVKPEPQYPGSCAPLVEYIVNVTDGPAANAGQDVTICAGTGTTISASVSGATGPYVYAWSHGLGNGSSKFVNPIFATTYTVTVTAGNGCTSTDQVSVGIAPSPSANAGAGQTICGGESATLTATASGGAGPYTFSWSNGLGAGATKIVSPSTTKTYTVTVTGSNGCASTSQVTVSVSSCVENCTNGIDDDLDGLTDCQDPDCAPDANAGMDVTICASSSITLTASVIGGGNGNFTYAWSNGLGAGVSKTVNPSVTTDYVVSITNNAGCTGTDTVRVTVVACPEDCTNGIDDDGDGLVDCEDPDCGIAGAPHLQDDYFTTCPGIAFSDRVVYNDDNLQDPVYSIFSSPSSGMVSIDGTGKFVYTPFGTDCFTDFFLYQVCNQTTGCCSQAAVHITMGDNNPPLLMNVPADVTISCDEAVPSPSQVLGFDACPGIYIDFEETSDEYNIGGCNSYTITRTWVASDLCGNSSTGQQVITVQDLTAPELFRVYTLANGKRLIAGVAQRTTDNWKYVPFPITFDSKPVVFTQIISENEISAVVIQHRNISTQGFEMKLEEQEASNGLHQNEKIAWMAVEKGAVDHADFGLEVAENAGVTGVWTNLAFGLSYPQTPGIVSSVQTINEADPVVPRFQSVSGTGASVMLQEEASKDVETIHSAETLGYFSFTTGVDLTDENGDFFAETGSLSLTNAWATVNLRNNYLKPVVIIGGVSFNDGDPVTVRVKNVTSGSFSVRLQEWDYQDGTHGAETVSYIVVEGSVPTDVGYYCGGRGGINLQPGVNVFAQDNCDFQTAFNFNESETMLSSGLLTTRTWTALDDCGNVTLASRADTCTVAALRLKSFLHGALMGNGGTNLMRDDLRVKNLLPATEPYSGITGYVHKGGGGGETLDPSLLTVTGGNAIVDWLFIEIRDSLNAGSVLATKSVLLQRDGDVVTAEGEDILFFPNVVEGEYYVVLRHRNHLGVMTDNKWFLSSLDPQMVDLTDMKTPISGLADGGKIVNGKRSQWAGDFNSDREVIYQGPDNDIFYLFSRVLSDPGNVNYLANYISTGYDRNDFNMDGNIIYQGPGNERANLLYHTVLAHPSNKNFLANYIVRETLP